MFGSDETVYQLYGEQGLAEKRKCGALGKWIPALNRCAYAHYDRGYTPNPNPAPKPPPQIPEAPDSDGDEAINNEIKVRTAKRGSMKPPARMAQQSMEVAEM